MCPLGLLAFKRGQNLADTIVKSRLPPLDDQHVSNETTLCESSREPMPVAQFVEPFPIGDLSSIEWNELDHANIQCLVELMSE